MAKYVLDTHAFVFALREPKRLGRRARAVLTRIDAGKDDGMVPAAVAAEVILLREKARTAIGLPELKQALSATRWSFVPLDLEQLDRFATLGALVDPFDRLIVAAALARDARLISRDQRIGESGLVDVVWD
jgi:PIN domain nuclease of toxin-antitoxin system